jgi:hypothetical protein
MIAATAVSCSSWFRLRRDLARQMSKAIIVAMSNPTAVKTPATAAGLRKNAEAPPPPFPGMSEGLLTISVIVTGSPREFVYTIVVVI